MTASCFLPNHDTSSMAIDGKEFANVSHTCLTPVVQEHTEVIEEKHMIQTILTMDGDEVREWELPAPNRELVPGVCWGYADSVFSPAYWAIQLRLTHGQFNRHCFRTGNTLFEETVFCLLGGHGISYELNCAAFEHLRQSRLLEQKEVSVDQLANCLAQPLAIDDRVVRYRFPNRRAEFIAKALMVFRTSSPPEDAVELRSWLMVLPGIGPKTASWIVRNWLDSDAVAIIDIHLHRAGLLAGIFDFAHKVERHYFEMERKFLAFAAALGARPSLLDGLIWAQMREMPSVVDMELNGLRKRRFAWAPQVSLAAA